MGKYSQKKIAQKVISQYLNCLICFCSKHLFIFLFFQSIVISDSILWLFTDAAWEIELKVNLLNPYKNILSFNKKNITKNITEIFTTAWEIELKVNLARAAKIASLLPSVTRPSHWPPAVRGGFSLAESDHVTGILASDWPMLRCTLGLILDAEYLETDICRALPPTSGIFKLPHKLLISLNCQKCFEIHLVRGSVKKVWHLCPEK